MHSKQAVPNIPHGLNEQIAASWDANVHTRAEDLEDGTDSTYIHIIKPWVLNCVMQHTNAESRILDAGCGCGYLTNAIYETGRTNIRGIDISAASIYHAQEKYPDISFACEDICRYTPAERYDMCLAIMMLNNLASLDEFFLALGRLLFDSGRAVLVIPHPCCWPQRHLANQDYSYFQEQPYEYAFSTQGRTDYASKIFYFHRTMETYFRLIRNGGFQITMLRELKETCHQAAPDILAMELARA